MTRFASACLLGLWLVCGVGAQTLNITSDPADMARVALGSDPGSASVAVWRGGAMRVATVRNGASTSAPALALWTPDERVPLYEIGSISKVFTGLLLAQAVERGELSLEDSLGGLLQGKVVFASAPVAAITLGQLITHRSCLPRQFGGLRGGPAVVAQIRTADRAALWVALASQKLEQAGPCPARYSNYGLAVVGELLSERAGKPWSELVREHITAPLLLSDTLQQLGDRASRLMPAFDGRNPAQPWDMLAFAGAGGLRSSVQDLALFGRAIAIGRAGPLGAAAERLVTPLAPYAGGQIGYAVFISGSPARRTWSHNGLTGGYRALLTIYPDSGEVMAALVSNGQAPLPRMGAELSAARYPVTNVAVPLDPAKLPDYQGVYRVDDEFALYGVVHDGALYLRSSGSVFRAYIPVGPDVFTRPAGGAQVRFARRDGVVVSLTLEQGGNVTVAPRTAEPVPENAVLAPGVAQGFAGRYAAARLLRSPIEFDVTDIDGQLMVRSSRFAGQPVFPVAGRADRFRYDGPVAELQFERDTNGALVALVLHENGELRAQKVGAAP